MELLTQTRTDMIEKDKCVMLDMLQTFQLPHPKVLNVAGLIIL